MNKTIVFLAIAGFCVLLGVTTWLMLSNRKNRTEVCMSYQGRSACNVASGETPEAAIRTATDGACAQIASGVTETTQCTHSQPASVRPLK